MKYSSNEKRPVGRPKKPKKFNLEKVLRKFRKTFLLPLKKKGYYPRFYDRDLNVFSLKEWSLGCSSLVFLRHSNIIHPKLNVISLFVGFLRKRLTFNLTKRQQRSRQLFKRRKKFREVRQVKILLEIYENTFTKIFSDKEFLFFRFHFNYGKFTCLDTKALLPFYRTLLLKDQRFLYGLLFSNSKIRLSCEELLGGLVFLLHAYPSTGALSFCWVNAIWVYTYKKGELSVPVIDKVLNFFIKSGDTADNFSSFQKSSLFSGTILSVLDGVLRISNITSARIGDLLYAGPHKIPALVLNLEPNVVGAALLGSDFYVKVGDLVFSSEKIVSIRASYGLLGKVVDPLGNRLDKGDFFLKNEMNFFFWSKKWYGSEENSRAVDTKASGIISRESVKQPLQTGLKCVDSLVPIGRGQRELIIGDRQTGKTAICIDTIINQKIFAFDFLCSKKFFFKTGSGRVFGAKVSFFSSKLFFFLKKGLTFLNENQVYCIYVGIGQKKSMAVKLKRVLELKYCMSFTTIMFASASDPAPLQYLAPYAGCALGEFFLERGHDVLVIYDDLSKHAVAYRQMSLLLRRPPGREAYPGDVFYLHSRLLERGSKIHSSFGGGSLTALPIVETLGGDVSAYIPTNVISITDGQIFLETGLFFKGIRPAINPGLSVSRVGSAAQSKVMKQVSGSLKIELAQFRELESFSSFGSDLDEATQKQLERGYRLTEVLKQVQYDPKPLAHQVFIIFAAIEGFLDQVKLSSIVFYEQKLVSFLLKSYSMDLICRCFFFFF